jgi:hypothetical protein
MAIKDRAPAVPNGWKAQFDDKYQTWFYVNLSSGKSQWEAPPSTKFPDEDKNLEPPPYAPSAASSSPVSATATGDSRGANKDPQPALQQQQYYQQGTLHIKGMPVIHHKECMEDTHHSRNNNSSREEVWVIWEVWPLVPVPVC